MFWFATWRVQEETQAKYFASVEVLWEWLEKYNSDTGSLPHNLCVFKAECIADFS